MRGWKAIPFLFAIVAGIAGSAAGGTTAFTVREYPVPSGSRPHDVAPARDGGVWYTAQNVGALGWLDPKTGKTRHTPLGDGSAPHGVIVGPDGAPWITDGGLNAIVRVDPKTRQVRRFPLPASSADANLNTAVFDRRGVLWFTGQSGIYGKLDPRDRQGAGLRGSARAGAVRHHNDTVGRRLLRVPRGQLSRPRRCRDLHRPRAPATDP